jgi:hypothetical protein
MPDPGPSESELPTLRGQAVPEAEPSESELPTLRHRTRSGLPPQAQHTLPSARHVERRALPFARPEGRRGVDTPMPGPVSDPIPLTGSAPRPSAEPLRHDSPWSQHLEIDREALPSSLMPAALDEELGDGEERRRAQRVSLVVWVAVAAVAVAAAFAMWSAR